MDIEKLKAKKSNANLNTEDLFGLKKKNDAVKRFREVFGDFKERGLNEDTIIEAFAQSLCDFPVGFIEDIA